MGLYCMKCREWLYDSSNHECADKILAVVDPDLRGIANRLYDMGIEPLTAMTSIMEVDKDSLLYKVNIMIDLGRRISEQVLGELPAGWTYLWETVSADHSEIYLINFFDYWRWIGFEPDDTVEGFVGERIKEFERFLESKDCQAVRAIMTLLGC